MRAVGSDGVPGLKHDELWVGSMFISLLKYFLLWSVSIGKFCSASQRSGPRSDLDLTECSVFAEG